MNKTLRRAGPEPPATRGLLGEVAAAARRAALGVVPGQRGLVSGCLGQPLELPSLGWGGCPALTLSEMALWTGAGPAFNTKPGITWPEPDPPSSGISTPGHHILALLWERVGNLLASTSPFSPKHGQAPPAGPGPG